MTKWHKKSIYETFKVPSSQETFSIHLFKFLNIVVYNGKVCIEKKDVVQNSTNLKLIVKSLFLLVYFTLI